MAASIILWKGNNHVIVSVLLMIAMLLNVIRKLASLWNKRRLK
jgi:hypothetical protein